MDDLYKKALDCAFDGVLISDCKGVVVYVNPQYEKTTGLKNREILGKNLQDLLDRRIISRAISLEVLKSGETISTIHRYASGKSALSSANPICGENGKVLGVVNNTRNVDELIALRQELQEHRSRHTKSSREIDHLREILDKKSDFIYTSREMADTIKLADKVAPFDTTVVIYGESGTGKEVLARYIHKMSRRADSIFVKVNCAAIPKELFESELFGYEKGAFTGASEKGKIGLFELANGGTLFLDEIGELLPSVQSKLLRAIQEKEIQRVGGKEPIKLDIRLMAATNRNLLADVKEGAFREDLYFRLNVFPITISPLRERRDDVPALIDYFIEKLNNKYKTKKGISPEALDALLKYDFPGNVRELENVIEYLYVMCEESIQMETIPGKILSQIMISEYRMGNGESRQEKLPYLVDLYEKTIIEDAIAKYHTLEEASKVLGIHYSTLSRKMQKYGLRFPGNEK